MKENWKNLITAIAIPLAAGSLSALLAKDGISSFSTITKPPLTPPAAVFPIIWTILYILMGIASYLVIMKNPDEKALSLYGLQLLFNFFWFIWFFRFGWYLFAFFWLIALWLLILATTLAFFRISRPAGYLMLPYLIWVTIAGYLNLGVYLLNP